MTRAEADDDDDGRSVLFWVAIAVVVGIPVLIVLTVIGAAVIGAFVLGLGAEDGAASAPQVTWEHEYDDVDGTLVVEQTGGEPVPADELVVDGTDDWSTSDDPLVPGERIVVHDVDPGDEVTIRWTDGETSVVLLHHEVPG